MLKYFICPDGEQITTQSCLEKCRMHTRCASRNYLKAASHVREWTGTPSVTQLLIGPRQLWLELKHPYAIKPEDRTFAIIGTRANVGLDEIDAGEQLTAERLRNAITHGEFDLYEIDNGKGVLTDRKTWGSYKVKRSLDGDMFEVTHQINFYRLLLEEAGFKVDEMWVEVYVRDGGTWMAKKSGIDKKLYRLPVEFLPNQMVKSFFDERCKEFMAALETNKIPRPCSSREAWDGKKCDGFCPVSAHCIKNGDNPYAK